MKEKEIINEMRHLVDNEMELLGFEFNKRWGSYRKFNAQEQLYFEISLLFFDFVATSANHKSKYLEIFTNIYHVPTSKLLLETTMRGKNLDSFFFFKIVGNMLSDIVLNPDWCNYTSRNNHKYFKMWFVTEEDVKPRSGQFIELVHKHVVPFFQKLDTLEKIKNNIDCCYDKGIAISNVNNERLLSLVALLFQFNDPLKNEKVQQIRNFFNSLNHTTATLELSSLIQKLKSK